MFQLLWKVDQSQLPSKWLRFLPQHDLLVVCGTDGRRLSFRDFDLKEVRSLEPTINGQFSFSANGALLCAANTHEQVQVWDVVNQTLIWERELFDPIPEERPEDRLRSGAVIDPLRPYVWCKERSGSLLVLPLPSAESQTEIEVLDVFWDTYESAGIHFVLPHLAIVNYDEVFPYIQFVGWHQNLPVVFAEPYPDPLLPFPSTEELLVRKYNMQVRLLNRIKENEVNLPKGTKRIVNFYKETSKPQLRPLSYEIGGSMGGPCFSPDERLFAVSHFVVEVRDLNTREILFQFDDTGAALSNTKEFTGAVGEYYWSSPIFSPDSRYLYCGSPQGMIFCWDLTSGAVVGQVQAHQGYFGLGISHDGRHLLSQSHQDGTILWRLS